MTTVRRDELVPMLRRRLLAGARSGAIARGARLPSVRVVAEELGTDPRLVLAAYRELAGEGLVELRPRSGIYALLDGPTGGRPAPEGWLVEVLADAVAREIPAPEALEWLRRALETLRLRALVAARTLDQLAGLQRELQVDYGFETEDADPTTLLAEWSTGTVPAALRRATVLVTTEGCEADLRPLAAAAGTPLVVASVRPDLLGDTWRALLAGGPVYLVAVDRRFGELTREYLGAAAASLRSLVVGDDDLSQIPADAPVYVTMAARARLGDRSVPGRLLPPARTFSTESSTELLRFIVRANLAAHAAGAAVGRAAVEG